MASFQSLELQRAAYEYLVLSFLSSPSLTIENYELPHLFDEMKHSITTSDTDNASLSTMKKGPTLHDHSYVYIYRTSSSVSEATHDLGAIGDHLCSAAGALSASDDVQSTYLVHSQASTLHDLVAGSMPDLDRYEVLRPIEQSDLCPIAWATPSNENILSSMPNRKILTSSHNQSAKLPVIVHDPASEAFKNHPLSTEELIALNQDTTVSPITPSGLETMSHLQQQLMDLVVTPELAEQMSASPSTIHIRDSPSIATQDSISSLGEDVSLEDLEPLIAPIWRRRGPSFASIIKHLNNRYQFSQRAVGQPEESIQSTTFQDRLDPEEFSLPYGSIVYSIKSNSIGTLLNAIKYSIWSSTLGSNKVLTEAYNRKKPEEKIILLFSVTHSVKHGNKYLGMAEMVGPLDFTSNGRISAEEQPSPQGIIPIRCIVAKDVPFASFHDLTYHEQPVTQVRHGNTIPGEVGRLVIQRYFEAAHWPTATLHPLSQNTGLGELSTAGVGRLRSRSQKSSYLRRDQKGMRGHFGRGYGNGRNQHGLSDGTKFAPNTSSLNMNGLSHTQGDSIHRAARRGSEPTTAQQHLHEALSSNYGRVSASMPDWFLRMASSNGLSF